MDAQPVPSDSTLEPDPKQCHRCGAVLSPDADACPQCGQKLYRLCFCGQSLPAGDACCPACGTDWGKSVRIRRRSRSEKIRPRVLLRIALLGALIALIASGLLNVIITALAQRATPQGVVPAGLGQKLSYAWYTLGTGLSKLMTTLMGGLGPVLVIAVLGAAVAVAIYLLPSRLGRLSRLFRDERVRRRRSHR